MSTRPVLASLAAVVGAVLVGFAGGVVGARALELGGLAPPAIVAVAVTALFVVRPAEGIAAFGIAILLSESLAHWTGADLRLLDEVGLALLLLATVAVHRRRIVLPRLGVAEIGLATLVLAAIASSIVNGVPAAIAAPGLALLLKGFVFFYLVASLRLGADELRRAVVPVFAVSLAIALVGLVQFVDPRFAGEVLRLPSSGRQRAGLDLVGSVFTHPALFGWLTAFVSLFLYARFAIRHAGWSLLLALALNAGTLVSGRRTPVVGVVVALVVGAARQVAAGRARLRTWALVGLAAVVLLGASVPLLGGFYAATLEQYGAPPDVVAEVFADEPDPRVLRQLHPRVGLYAGAVAIARDHLPLGGGVGRFASHMSRVTYSPLYEEYGLHRIYGLRAANPIAVTDTFWPMILGESGILGLAGTLLFFGGVGMRLWRAARPEGQHPEVAVFALGALLVFTEGLVRSFTSAVFVAPPIAYFVFGAAGLVLAVRRAGSFDPGLSSR